MEVERKPYTSAYKNVRLNIGSVVPIMGNKRYVMAMLESVKSENHDILFSKWFSGFYRRAEVSTIK
jgi:hypothetical protein